MAKIPTSQGVQARPNLVTPQVRQPVDTGERFIAQGVAQLGNAIANVGLQKMQDDLREQEAYNTSQVLSAKNEIRRFDNEQRIKLAELPADQETINTSKQNILEERKVFAQELKGKFGDNKQLLKLIEREEQTSQVDLEFLVDKELSRKKQTFGQNQFFQSVSDLRDQFEQAQSNEEMMSIANDLNITQQTALKAGIIDVRDVERIEKDFRQIRKLREEEAIKTSAFNDVMNGSLLLDPTDKDSKEIINNAYNQYLLEGENPVDAGIEIGVQSGILPDRAKNIMVSQLLVGQPKEKIESSKRIVQMQEANYALQDDFSSTERAFARAIYNRADTGLNDEDIIEFATKEIADNKSKEQIVRLNEFNEGLKGKKLQQKKAAIERELKGKSGITFFDPEIPVDDIPEEIVADIMTVAKDFYLKEGVDIDASFDEAESTVLRQWGITKIGQKRYQKFSPEIMYPTMSASEIEKQAKKTIQKHLLLETETSLFGNTSITEEAEKTIRLEPIPQTLNTDRPQYWVMHQKQDGSFDILRDAQNQFVNFAPDITKTKKYQAADNNKRELLIKEFAETKDSLRKRSKEKGFEKLKREQFNKFTSK